MSSKDKLFALFLDGTLAGKTVTEILKTLQIPYREKSRVEALLKELCDKGLLFRNDGGRYGTIEQLGLIKGKISGHERGFAFLVPEDKDKYEKDFFIPHKN
nr:ribonuclease R [Clostridia bacterium]